MKRLVMSLVIAAFFLTGATLFAMAASSESSAPTVDVCVKPNGQLRVLTPSNPCVEPETRNQWTVNGTKDVQPGPGLNGSNNSGIVSLQVDPGLIENANASKIFAGFDDGPGFVSGIEKTLTLPAGAYAIFAKLTLIPGPAELSGPVTVLCRLEAGADFDASRAFVPSQADDDLNKLVGLTLEVVHSFAAAGSAVLSCEAPHPDCPELCFDLGPQFENLKIIAIRASSLSNGFLD